MDGNGNPQPEQTKFCMYCGAKIPKDAVVCTHCGRQVERMQPVQTSAQPIVINNTNTNMNANYAMGPGMRNKWVAVALCLLLGWVGGHKFYEGKGGMGILYIFTLGLGGIGVLVDLVVLLCKPKYYYPY